MGPLRRKAEDELGAVPNLDGDYAIFSDTLTDFRLQTYTVGPLAPFAEDADLDPATTVLTFRSGSTDSGEVYIDNIVIREVEDIAYKIQNSWVIPSTCDQTPEGAPAPQFNLGCQSYETEDDETVPLKSFSAICRESAVGCEAFYDTQNSRKPYGGAYNMSCTLPAIVNSPTACTMNSIEVCTVLAGLQSCRFSWDGTLPTTLPGGIAIENDSVVVPRDERTYLVDNPSARCSEAATGCTALGEPTFDASNETITEFTEVARRILPDDFDRFLRKNADLFCRRSPRKTTRSTTSNPALGL